MLLSAVSAALVVAQSSSEIPEGLMNNPVLLQECWNKRSGLDDSGYSTLKKNKPVCNCYLKRINALRFAQVAFQNVFDIQRIVHRNIFL